jgi:FtsZ-binding cell division protein ZapB
MHHILYVTAPYRSPDRATTTCNIESAGRLGACPGIDPMMRAITNLTLSKAEVQTLRQHKTHHMEAAEETRRALEAQAQSLREEDAALRARVVNEELLRRVIEHLE